MIEAILLNPSSRRTSRRGKSSSSKRSKRRTTMRRKRSMPKRNSKGRFVKSGRKVRRSKKRRKNPASKAKLRRKVSRKLTKRGPKARGRGAAAKKGWSRRKASKKYWAKTRRGSKRRFARNPFSIGGRRGKFDLIPSVNTLKAAAMKGAGAVASDVVKSTIYSTLLAKFRPMGPTSVAENTVASLISGGLTGIVAGYVGGAKVAADMVEGAYTVTLYKLVADVFARATNGKAKLFGFISNPFTSVPTMPILPALGVGGSAPASNGVSGLRGLRGVVPEGRVLPLGAVVPERNVLPLGQSDYDPAELPERFRSRF